MIGVTIRGRWRLRALILGLLVTGLLYLPPVSIVPRLDGAWSWLWSAVAPRPNAAGILLLKTDDVSWVPRLARIAQREHAKLLITTWNVPQPADSTKPGDPTAATPARTASAAAIREVTPADIQAHPDQVNGKIIVAGPASPTGGTSVDARSMAQTLAADEPNPDRPGLIGLSVGWLIALLALGVWLFKVPQHVAEQPVVSASGPAGLGVLSGAAWLLGGWAIPIAGPVTWLSLTAGFYHFGRRLGARHRRASQPEKPEGVRLAEAGRIDEAWRWYRNQTVSGTLLEPLYTMACAFETHGRRDLAADVFYAVAQADAGFRDVTRRLIAASRSEAAPVAHPPPAPFASLPANIGRYELLEEIGHGSAAHVFLGRDPRINRLVAVKVIDLSSDLEAEERTEARTRFLREASTAGRLNHRGIVTVFDVDETDGRAYIAMEYSKGRRLSDFTAKDKRLPTTLVLELIAQTAEALHYAHQQNVVHRDIKPANIMYDSVWESVKITDFGIARLIDVSRTRTGVVLGTPSYMAPEQLEGENVNGHTDLFALGVSLYQLLTGHLPFQGNSMTTLMFVIANEPHALATAVDPQLPLELNPLLDTALAKEPGNRFASGAEMADALRAAAARIS